MNQAADFRYFKRGMQVDHYKISVVLYQHYYIAQLIALSFIEYLYMAVFVACFQEQLEVFISFQIALQIVDIARIDGIAARI